MYVIQYVWISTLTIVFIVYSTSGHPNITLNFQTLISETSRNTLALIWNSTLSSIKAMLCSRLTSKLLDADYRNIWTHDSRLVQHMSWSHHPNPLWIPTSSWVVQCTNFSWSIPSTKSHWLHLFSPTWADSFPTTLCSTGHPDQPPLCLTMPEGSLFIGSQIGARTLIRMYPLGLGNAEAFWDHVAITWQLCNHVPLTPPHWQTT